MPGPRAVRTRAARRPRLALCGALPRRAAGQHNAHAAALRLRERGVRLRPVSLALRGHLPNAKQYSCFLELLGQFQILLVQPFNPGRCARRPGRKAMAACLNEPALPVLDRRLADAGLLCRLGDRQLPCQDGEHNAHSDLRRARRWPATRGRARRTWTSGRGCRVRRPPCAVFVDRHVVQADTAMPGVPVPSVWLYGKKESRPATHRTTVHDAKPPDPAEKEARSISLKNGAYRARLARGSVMRRRSEIRAPRHAP